MRGGGWGGGRWGGWGWWGEDDLCLWTTGRLKKWGISKIFVRREKKTFSFNAVVRNDKTCIHKVLELSVLQVQNLTFPLWTNLCYIWQGFSWCDEFTAKVLTKFCKQNCHSKYFYHGGTVIDLKDYSPMTDLVMTTSQYWGMRKDGKQKT